MMHSKTTAGGSMALLLAVGTLVASARADVITLVSGEKIVGEVVERTNERVVLNHELLGRLEVPTSSLVADDRTDTLEDIRAAAMQEEAEAAAEEAKEWSFSLILAASGDFGNTDTQDFTLRFTGTRETAEVKTAIDAGYTWGASNGDRDDNSATAGIIHDWYTLLPDPWLVFATGRYDFDEFKSWDYRIQGHGGVGYKLIQEDDFRLTLRVGGGAVKEFNSDNDDIRPELMLGGNLEWNISEKQTLKFGSFVWPDLDDTGEFRTLTRLNWDLLLDEELNLSIYAGVEHEYETVVDRGQDHNDWKVLAGIKLDF